jgi:MtfA peptidase
MKLVGNNKKFLKRLTAILHPFSNTWRDFIISRSPYYPLLDRKIRRRFERDIKIFLSEVTIKYRDGKGEKKVPIEFRLLIAMGFATLLIGRPNWELPLPNEIIIFSQDRILKNSKAGKVEYAALATEKILFLTEKNLIHSFHFKHDGYNNIFHEIAHYLDFEDYEIDGAPSYKRFIKGFKQDASECKRMWKKIMETEFERARNGELPIRSYAIKNSGEFLACVTELFFEKPGELKKISQNLYRLLKLFYKFDPLEVLYKSQANG